MRLWTVVSGLALWGAATALAQYGDTLRVFSTHDTDKLRSLESGQEVLIGGMLTLVRLGNTKKAREYVNTLLGTPEQVTTLIKAEKEEAERGLRSVQDAIRATPSAHTVNARNGQRSSFCSSGK